MKRFILGFTIIAIIGMQAFLYFTFRKVTSQDFGQTIPTVVALFETSLASKITSSATSATLVAGTDKQGNALSGTYGFIIDEGSANEEFVVCSATSTALTSCTRGISVTDGKTGVTALQKEHRRGASVKITNYPQLAILSRILNGTEKLPNRIAYESHPSFAGTVASTALVSRYYADNLALAGCPNATTTLQGCAEQATVAETNAGTGTGATGARLFVGPSELASSNYASYLPTSGEKAGLAGILASLSASNKLISLSNIWGKDLTTSQKVLTFALTASASGDILYRNTSGDYVNLGASQSGGFLMTRGTASAPIWSRPTIAKGNTTHAVGVGSETITHALGYVPKIVSLNYAQGFTQTFAQGSGDATASTSEQSVYCSGNVNSTAAGCAQSASYILTTTGTDASTVCSQADIQSITSQSFKLYFSTSTTAGNCGGGGNVLINWKAQ